MHVTGSSLIVGMPVLRADFITSPLEILVVPLKVVAMSLPTTITSLPLKVMAMCDGHHEARRGIQYCLHKSEVGGKSGCAFGARVDEIFAE